MTITGADLLARTLVKLDTGLVFSIAGFGMQPFMEALDAQRDELKLVSSFNETNIGLIAHGYARASGRATFLGVYHASGTALAMMALTTAWADRAPLVMVSTTSSRKLSGRDSYAGVPYAVTEMSAQFTKWRFEVPSADRLPEVFARAFAIAQTPPMGPVHIAIPLDVYTEAVDEAVLDDLHPLVVPQLGSADSAAVQEAASVLAASTDTILVFGGEPAQYGGVEAAIALAEELGASVFTEAFPARFSFPTTHPQYVGKISDFGHVLDEADAIVYVGAELTEMRQPAQDLLRRPRARRIIMTVDPLLAVKFFTPDIALIGAPQQTFEALGEAVRALRRDACPGPYAVRRDAALERRRAFIADGFDASPMRAGRIIHEVASVRQDVTVVSQPGSLEAFAHLVWELDEPDRYFGLSAKGSAQGWLAPAAIGIGLAIPERPVIALVGDGGLMFSATAIYTAAKLGVQVIYVVADNGGWRDIGASSRSIGGESHLRESDHGWVFDSPQIDLVGFASSLGLRATHARTPDEFAGMLAQALEFEGPSFIVVDSDPVDADYFFQPPPWAK